MARAPKAVFTSLRDAVALKRTIRSGRAAGLVFAAPRRADPAFAAGHYERPVQEAIVAILSEGGVFYDIGANLGFFSLLGARIVGAGGHVYAFEPVPRNAEAIRRSVRLNGLENVTVFTEAVGAGDGRGELRLARHLGGAALASVEAPPDARGAIPVEIVALDAVIARRTLQVPTLVKIDVEGAELKVLQGMEETLRHCRPILLYEVDDAQPAGADRKAQALAGHLAGSGYGLHPLPPAYPEATWVVRHILATPSERDEAA